MPAKFAAAAPVSQPMMDDQQCTITWSPVEADGTAAALPSGAVPTVAAAPGTAVTVSSDPTGLITTVKGVKGQQGAEVVTLSFTNADGTVATGVVTMNMTVDPTELDVSGFTPTVSTPVAQ